MPPLTAVCGLGTELNPLWGHLLHTQDSQLAIEARGENSAAQSARMVGILLDILLTHLYLHWGHNGGVIGVVGVIGSLRGHGGS